MRTSRNTNLEERREKISRVSQERTVGKNGMEGAKNGSLRRKPGILRKSLAEIKQQPMKRQKLRLVLILFITGFFIILLSLIFTLFLL